jgi:hypothetical protein
MTGFSEDQRLDTPVGRLTTERPPLPPTIDRRFSLTKKQWVGLPFLAAIPILTLFGVFGERRAETGAQSSTLAVSVRYPERFRYRQIQALDITVKNLTRAEIDTVHVSLDTAYITRFSSVRIEPEPLGAFVVDLLHVKPQESRLVSAEVWGERYGRHHGRILVVANGDTVGVSLSTLVFP